MITLLIKIIGNPELEIRDSMRLDVCIWQIPVKARSIICDLLLTQRRGITSFEDLRTINGNIHETFKQACEAMGLLESDDEWDKLLEESSSYQIPTRMRRLFANILMYCSPRNPGELWGKY